MRRRNRELENGSLDLLLDTICNTFGGVVFISLLVVLLLNTTSERVSSSTPTPSLQAAFIETENRRRALSEQLDLLRQAITGQEDIMDIVASTEAVKLAEQLGRSQDGHAALVSEESTLTGEVSQTQKQINQLAASAAGHKSELETAKDRLLKLKRQVEITVEQNVRTAVIPKVVMSTQPPQTFFLKGGRLYGPRSLQGSPLNASEFEIVDVNGNKVLQERAGGGVAVDASGKQNGPATKKLKDPWLQSFYVKLFVWPDSYGHVEAVRVILDGLNIRCEIKPCETDTQVVLSSNVPSGPAPVQ